MYRKRQESAEVPFTFEEEKKETHLIDCSGTPKQTHDTALLEEYQIGRHLFNRVCCKANNDDSSIPVDKLRCKGSAYHLDLNKSGNTPLDWE